MADNGIITKINEICENICDNYCKFPDEYSKKFKDADEATNKLYAEKCMKCPLDELLS